MKAVHIFGSPHKDGFTRRLAEIYISSLPKECEITEFNAYEMNAAPCVGCGCCAKENICINDDLDSLAAAIYDCDMIIISAPVYYLSFPAPLKAITDRFQRFFEAERRGDNFFHNKERKAAVLLTAGTKSERGEMIKKQLRWILPSLGARLEKMLVCPETDKIAPSSLSEDMFIEV